MAVVAPVTASCAVAIPVAADLLAGAQPGMRVGAGIVLAIVAVVFLSQARTTGTSAVRHRGLPPGLGLALVAGAAIGFFFLLLARAGDAGLWPLVSARVVSVALFGAAAVVTGTRLVMERRPLTMAVGGGALDMVANALYLIATRDGELSAVVTLASLYPASTVLLARVVLAERLTVLQMVGIGCALIAVLLIVAP
jgi:drug/metabolite transporter (DMT)-like permease